MNRSCEADRIGVSAADSPEVIRKAAQAWVDEHVPPAWLAAAIDGGGAHLHEIRSAEDYRAWYPTLARSGLVAPHWPVEHGGLGLGPEAARTVNEVLARARLPRLNVIGLGLAGPTILAFGSEEQCSEHLWPTVTAERIWCQLFSEPGAGSDLAGLSTRARPVGDGWLVTGQKVWSSHAELADFGLLLARTDPAVPKHRGLTYFLLDLRSEGVTVRPLRQMTGDAEFSEVFLDEVFVPDSARLGPVGAGWKVALSTLMNERTTLSGGGSGFGERLGGRSVDGLIALARDRVGEGGAIDPVTRQRITRLWIEGRVLRWTNERARTMREVRRAGPEGSIGKLYSTEHNQRVQALAFELLGARALACEDGDPIAARVIDGLLRSRCETIAGGTSEIQRNILGERVLGLPGEQAVDRDRAWEEIPRNG